MPTLEEVFPGYIAPKKCLAPCKHCGVTVQGRMWLSNEKRFVEVNPRISPITGAVHVCQAKEEPPGERP